jgi:hypothetical protein
MRRGFHDHRDLTVAQGCAVFASGCRTVPCADVHINRFVAKKRVKTHVVVVVVVLSLDERACFYKTHFESDVLFRHLSFHLRVHETAASRQ